MTVQNAFPAREVDTATASNNYFRQIGASLGSAVVGTLVDEKPLATTIERDVAPDTRESVDA